MTRLECERETQVVSAVLSGRWPDDCDEQLRSHADSCSVCREVVTVAALFRDDVEDARRGGHVPAAGQVWWRAAVRARLEAAQAAQRPVTWLHGIAGASAAGLGAALLTIGWPTIRSAADWVSLRMLVPAARSEQVETLLAAVQHTLPLALGVAAIVVLAPIALYFALSDE